MDTPYVKFNRSSAHEFGVTDLLTRFVARYELHRAKVLEVGAGSGTLQDIVEDYTGLDIASTASRYFRKPFVHGSATNLPFEDNAFDVIWTVWTIEHVPNPERALVEMRRVIRNGGVLFLYPAWNVPRWAPQGHSARPLSDLEWSQRLSRSTLKLRSRMSFQKLYLIPIRTVRGLYWKSLGQPTALRYTRLEPNYTNYWVADSDAVNSLDSFEALLWFLSRGDECLNCGSILNEIRSFPPKELIIRINKH
jgi:SAM-dependent methyltransferase